MIAALQMYDWPENRGRTDAFWAAVRDELIAAGVPAPEALARPADLSAPWADADLLLGQTCGLPYVEGRCPGAVLLARPTYGLPGTGAGTYSSALITRAGCAGDVARFVGCRAAINERGSQSGCNALLDAMVQAGAGRDGPVFSEVCFSGGHRFSADAVAAGDADIAAIDAVSWALYAEAEPDRHAALRVIGWTRPMPSLPFIMSAALAAHRTALGAALAAGIRAVNGTAIPTDLLPAADIDYDPIRKMARNITPLRLS